MKISLALTGIVLCLSLFLFPVSAYAKVWINEFSSYGSDDWVELYNDSSEVAVLDGLRLVDEASNKKDLEGEISGNEFLVIAWSNKLNKEKDLIKLVSIDNESTSLDQVTFGSGGEIMAPQAEQSVGRLTNGGNVWGLFSSPSKGSSNSVNQPVATPTPEPEKTPTPIKQPTPTKTPTPTKQPSVKKAVEPENEEAIESVTQPTTVPVRPVAKKVTISGVPTAILGISTISATPKPKARISQKPTEKVMVKSASATPLIFMVSGTIFCMACGILVFLKNRNGKHET